MSYFQRQFTSEVSSLFYPFAGKALGDFLKSKKICPNRHYEKFSGGCSQHDKSGFRQEIEGARGNKTRGVFFWQSLLPIQLLRYIPVTPRQSYTSALHPTEAYTARKHLPKWRTTTTTQSTLFIASIDYIRPTIKFLKLLLGRCHCLMFKCMVGIDRMT